LADLTARLSWINWENLGVNPNRRSVLTTLTLTADNMNNWRPSGRHVIKQMAIKWTIGQHEQLCLQLVAILRWQAIGGTDVHAVSACRLQKECEKNISIRDFVMSLLW